MHAEERQVAIATLVRARIRAQGDDLAQACDGATGPQVLRG